MNVPDEARRRLDNWLATPSSVSKPLRDELLGAFAAAVAADRDAEIQRLQGLPHCCPPCAVHDDGAALDAENVALRAELDQLRRRLRLEHQIAVRHLAQRDALAEDADELRRQLLDEALCARCGPGQTIEGTTS